MTTSKIKIPIVLVIVAVTLLAASVKSLAQDNDPTKTPINDPMANEPKDPAAPEGERQRTTWAAQIIRRQNPTNVIANLQFRYLTVPVYLIQSRNRFRPYVEMEVFYGNNRKELFVGGKKLARLSNGAFKLGFFLTSKMNQIGFEARPMKVEVKEGIDASQSPYSQNSSEQAQTIEKEIIYVQAPEAQEYRQTDPLNVLRVSLGGSLLNHYQTNFAGYAAWMTWLGASYQSPLIHKNFGWQFDLEGTIFAIKTNQTNISPQIYHGDVMGYYQFNQPTTSDFEYKGFAGLDYLTMQSNGATFGYKGLMSPRFGLSMRKVIDEKEDWIMRFGITPLDKNILNASLDFDISRSWLQENLRRFETGFRYMQYQITDSPPGTSVKTTVSTFYISYTL